MVVINQPRGKLSARSPRVPEGPAIYFHVLDKADYQLLSAIAGRNDWWLAHPVPSRHTSEIGKLHKSCRDVPPTLDLYRQDCPTTSSPHALVHASLRLSYCDVSLLRSKKIAWERPADLGPTGCPAARHAA